VTTIYGDIYGDSALNYNIYGDSALNYTFTVTVHLIIRVKCTVTVTAKINS
jgi:hypothetical protein